MTRPLLAIVFTFFLLGPTASYAASSDNVSQPVSLQASLEGTNLAVSSGPDNNITFAHLFPFTDERMKVNQAKFERYIEDLIISDLEKSENVTEAAEKYPLNSPVYLNIENKYAYHVLIEEFGIGLYTYIYDLSLNSCGPNVRNLKQINYKYKKGDLFNTQTILNRKYRNIIEGLISDSVESIKYNKMQEIPLFITVHPDLTFVPTAIVEDRLENLRVNFPQFKVRYCAACSNILAYDEYAYLSWLTVSNSGSPEDDSFFKPKEQNMINIGFDSKAIFAAYPLDIVVDSSNQDDKRVNHDYCLNNSRHVNAFVQNAYYARSLEKFTENLVSFIVDKINDSKESQSSDEVKVELPCYPKYFQEKNGVYQFKGTGDFEDCKKEIGKYIKINHVPSEVNRNFDFAQDKMPWPLESLKEGLNINEDVKVYIESVDLEILFQMNNTESRYKDVTLEDLNDKVKESCTELLEQEVSGLRQEHKGKSYLDRCIHWIYISSLLKGTGMKKDKHLLIRNYVGKADSWMKGVTMKHIETFHNLEKEWFDIAQDRSLETYLLKIKDTQELEKQGAMYVTFALIVALAVTFWIGFIVRFRNIEVNNEPVKDVKYR